jgi:hypothetical protein
MSALRRTRVDHRPPQRVGEVPLWLRLLSRQVIRSVLLHVEDLGEFEVAVDLDLAHLVEVELESLQDYGEDVRQLLDAESLQGPHFLLAGLAEVRIVSIQDFALHVAIQGLFEALFSPDVDSNREEVIYLLTFMGTSFAIQLIG